MNQRVFLACICLALVVSLVAVPVIAATLTCPSSCSCLLPAEAKKMGYTGYCGGRQAVCGYDSQKNEKYCYTKPVTTTAVPQMIITAKPFVTTTPTTIPPQICASGCTCLSSADGKGTGLLYCGGKQTLCGYDTNKTPLYCFDRATTPTTTPMLVTGLNVFTTTATPLPVRDSTMEAIRPACPAGCSCLAPDKADATGFMRCSAASAPCGKDQAGRAMYCYVADTVIAQKPSGTPTTTILIPPVISTTPETATTGQQGIGFTLRSLFGSMTGSSPQSSSPLQRTLCNGIYTNTMTDPANCGSCGAFCAERLVCTRGSCMAQERHAQACGPFQIQCNGACTDYLHDDENCGGCGTRCAVGQTCCSGHCTNTQFDRDNCYTCGTRCPDGATCSYGVCTCSNGTVMCGDRCADPRNDSQNCGGCNMQCGAGRTCCNGACTDTQNDLYNCGACNHFCASPYTCAEGRCVDVLTNEEHCGTDGSVCGEDQQCCSGRCISWKTDNDNCGYGCGNRCGRGETCCNGHCMSSADMASDNYNCGSCGNYCGYNTCCNGRCCGAAEICCESSCQFDMSNDFCGSCSRHCSWWEVCDRDWYSFDYVCCGILDFDCGSWG